MLRFHEIDPVFLKIGPLQFRWYGLMYILAFISGYFIVRAGIRNRKLGLDNEDVGDLIFHIAAGIILGGRVGYILFYNLSSYLSNPLKIFAVWEGGMSFHGGFLGAVIGGAIYCRKKNLNLLDIADVVFLSAPVGLMFGRVGNFINGELFGRVTDASWGMIFPSGGPLPRHPSQLYEAFLEGPLLFMILIGLYKMNVCRRGLVWAFTGCYGIFRFIVEFFREPDAQLGFVAGSFSMGQLLSMPMIILGWGMFFYTVMVNIRSVSKDASS